MILYNVTTGNQYDFNDKSLNGLKKQARTKYKAYSENNKLPVKKQMSENLTNGAHFKEFSVYFKTNHLKSFKGYLIVMSATKEHLYFN